MASRVPTRVAAPAAPSGLVAETATASAPGMSPSPGALPPSAAGVPTDLAWYAAALEISDPVLSPDGRTLAYLVCSDGRYQARLRQLDTGREAWIREEVHPGGMCWMPGSRLAFLPVSADDREPERPGSGSRIVVADRDGRTLRRHRLPRWVSSVKRLWSTDSRWYLLASGSGRGLLVAVSPVDGQAVTVTGPDSDIRDAAVAPDGTVVVVAARADHPGLALAELRPPSSRSDGRYGRLRVLDPASRAPGTREQLLDLSSDGLRVVYSHDDGAGRYSARWLWLADPVSRPLEFGPGTVLAARWRGSRVMAQVFDRMTSELRETRPEQPQSVRTVAEPGGGYPGFSVSADTGRFAYAAQRWDAPPEFLVSPAHGGAQPAVQVTSVHRARPASAGEGAAGADPAAGATARQIRWRSAADGEEIDGLLVTPAVAGPRPLVALLHGGPHHHWHAGWHGSWSDWARLLASRGYAVLCPNVRGSTGRGWEFAHAIHGDLATLPLADLESGIDDLVRSGVADGERLAVGGWSYGAYLSAWALTRTDRFRAGVLGAGMYDLHDLVTGSRLGPAWRRFCPEPSGPGDRVPYDRLSPLFQAGGCQARVLLAHGTDDGKVPVGQSRRMRAALPRASLLELPGAGHALTRTGDRRQLLIHMLDWYDRYL